MCVWGGVITAASPGLATEIFAGVRPIACHVKVPAIKNWILTAPHVSPEKVGPGKVQEIVKTLNNAKKWG